jgi:hypothetical protein
LRHKDVASLNLFVRVKVLADVREVSARTNTFKAHYCTFIAFCELGYILDGGSWPIG